MITATEMRTLTDSCRPIIERRRKDEVEAAKNVVLDRCHTRARHAAAQGQNSAYVEWLEHLELSTDLMTKKWKKLDVM